MKQQIVKSGLCVSVVLRDEFNKIFLLKRKNNKFENNKFVVPGGHVENGEKIIDAALRECVEEANVIPKNMIYTGCVRIRSDEDWMHFVFTARNWEGIPKIGEPNKFSESIWLSDEDILNRLDVAFFIPEYLNIVPGEFREAVFI